MNYARVIIIGAARSGTNMLRDVLTSIPKVGTWPCDEINYIWRHGNARCVHDEFTPDMATESIVRYIRLRFDRLARSQRLGYVVEKTCANSLRVGFVNAVVPDARFVFLLRDGRDVVASAMRRWTAPLDIRYVARKARFVPTADLPYYGLRYAANRMHKLASQEKRLAGWGPRYAGMVEAANHLCLSQVCARQWARSVEKAEEELARIPSDRVVRVRYEEFVAKPEDELLRVADSLGLRLSATDAARYTSDVNPGSVGAWRTKLGEEDQAFMIEEAGSVLEKHGYPVGGKE